MADARDRLGGTHGLEDLKRHEWLRDVEWDHLRERPAPYAPAGGAEVAAWDDNPASVEAAIAEGIPTVDLASADWSRFAALVLSPGVPLTHPRPHWTVALAYAAGVEVIAQPDVSAFSALPNAEATAEANAAYAAAATMRSGVGNRLCQSCG